MSENSAVTVLRSESIAVAVCCFVAGAVLGLWVLHLFGPSAPSPAPLPSAQPSVAVMDHTSSAVPPQPAASAAYTGPKFSATVTDVLDGDTVDVIGPNGAARIRLTGIDAPEHGQL